MALVASAALLAGCTTTHTLGRIDDPATRAQLNALAAEGIDCVHPRTETPTNRPPFGYRFAGIDPAGFVVEPGPGQSLVVPLSQVESVSRFDRWRGARNGAIAGGLVAFVMAAALLAFLQANASCSDGCYNQPDGGWPLVRAAAIVSAVGAVVGGGLGAAVGYEDRFIVARPK